MKLSAFLLGGIAALGIVAGAEAGTVPSGWVAVGNAGTGNPNGDVSAPPAQGPGYYYVSTVGGVSNGGGLPGVGGTGAATTGSNVTTNSFTASAGDSLEFYFNYVTSDGAGFADYGWARLLDGADQQVALLFTARTTPGGSSVPGFSMPTPEATLEPASVNIFPGAPVWDVLGSDSTQCWSNGCGSTGWVKSSFAIASDGTYKLQFGVTNWDDDIYQTGMAFAGAKVGDVIITPPAAVPLPASALLLLGGMGAIGALRRRRR